MASRGPVLSLLISQAASAFFPLLHHAPSTNSYGAVSLPSVPCSSLDWCTVVGMQPASWFVLVVPKTYSFLGCALNFRRTALPEPLTDLQVVLLLAVGLSHPYPFPLQIRPPYLPAPTFRSPNPVLRQIPLRRHWIPYCWDI